MALLTIIVVGVTPRAILLIKTVAPCGSELKATGWLSSLVIVAQPEKKRAPVIREKIQNDFVIACRERGVVN